MTSLWQQGILPGVLMLPLRHRVLAYAVRMASPLLDDVLACVEGVWVCDVASGDMSPQTHRRYSTLARAFCRYASADGQATLDEALACLPAWLNAHSTNRRGGWSAPSLSTRHLRACAVGALYRTARALALTSAIPPYEAREMSAEGRKGRPLNELEADTLRAVGTAYMHTRLAVAAAVGLSGGGTGDIGAMTPADVDLKEGTLWLPGGGRVQARTVAIPGQWEYDVLKSRLADLGRLGGAGSGLVVTRQGSPESRQAGAAMAVAEILSMAGLRRDPDVKPASLQRWAATVAFETTGDIAAAARVIGTTSLDTAADAIRWDWATQPVTVKPARPDYRPRVIP